jgi:hypothetical protein
VSAVPHGPTPENHTKETMSNRIRIAAPIAALALAAFAAGGCGSDDNGTSSSSTASTASVASTSSGTASTGGADTATTATGSGGTSGSAATPSVDDVLKGIHTVLRNQGLDDSVAQCVEDELRKSLTPEDVAGATGGSPSSEFRSKIAAAAQACDPNGGQ